DTVLDVIVTEAALEGGDFATADGATRVSHDANLRGLVAPEEGGHDRRTSVGGATGRNQVPGGGGVFRLVDQRQPLRFDHGEAARDRRGDVHSDLVALRVRGHPRVRGGL